MVQSVDSGPFERATEHGIAVAQGVPLEAAVLGYDRHDWDRRSSFNMEIPSRFLSGTGPHGFPGDCPRR